MATQTFNISFPEELVQQMDAAAKREYESRSDYIRKAVLDRMRAGEPARAVATDRERADFDDLMNTVEQVLDEYETAFKNLADR